MAYEIKNPYAITLVAGEDLSEKQYYAVKVDSNGECVLCDTAGEAVFGVLQNKPTSGVAGSVATQAVTKIVIGTGGLTAGAKWTTSATGTAVEAAAGDYVGGTVITGGSAGEIASVTVGFANAAQLNA